jgi:hypothetical protein
MAHGYLWRWSTSWRLVINKGQYGMSPTLMATGVQVAQIAASLICAYILMTVLKSTAIVKQKGVQLGGAVATFVVVMVLLNKYLPGIQAGLVQEAAASQQVSVANTSGNTTHTLSIPVALSPAVQLVTSRDLQSLDQNQFVVDQTLKVAVQRPVGVQWKVGPVASYDTLSMLDVPMLGMSGGLMSALVGVEGDTGTFAVERTTGSDVTIYADSQINGLSFSFNFFKDPHLLKVIMVEQAKSMKAMGLPSGLGAEQDMDAMLDEIGPMLQKQSDVAIKARFPFHKIIHDGVYVTFIDQAAFNGSIFSQVQPYSSFLDKLLMWTNLHQGLSGTVANLYVNQDLRVASYNQGVELKNVTIGGHRTDVRLNNVGFIVAGRDRGVVVNLIYLSTDGIEVFQQLQNEFDSLRFTGD